MIANGRGGLARPDKAVGMALQNMAREVAPPSPEDLPAIDPATLSPAERARSDKLAALFKNSPDFLAALDAALGQSELSLSATASPAGTSRGNGTDAGAPAPPSATQR
jgi:hypothetical protein